MKKMNGSYYLFLASPKPQWLPTSPNGAQGSDINTFEDANGDLHISACMYVENIYICLCVCFSIDSCLCGITKLLHCSSIFQRHHSEETFSVNVFVVVYFIFVFCLVIVIRIPSPSHMYSKPKS